MGKGQYITQMISVIDNLVRTFPVSFFGIGFCITMAKTLLGKSQTLTCDEGHQEPIACRRIHENPYIGTIETRQDIFKTRGQLVILPPKRYKPRKQRHPNFKLIRIAIKIIWCVNVE